jgi:hypothetical protein
MSSLEDREGYGTIKVRKVFGSSFGYMVYFRLLEE